MKAKHTRAMVISLFIIAISFFNFSNISGGECIRPIHIVTLLVCGIGIGIFILNFFAWLAQKRHSRQS